MNWKMKLFGMAALAATMTVGGSAWADCGALPKVPEIPADGAALTGKDMEKVAKDFDEYQTKFIEANDCSTKEYNEAQAKFKATIEAYSAKNKKK